MAVEGHFVVEFIDMGRRVAAIDELTHATICEYIFAVGVAIAPEVAVDVLTYQAAVTTVTPQEIHIREKGRAVLSPCPSVESGDFAPGFP